MVFNITMGCIIRRQEVGKKKSETVHISILLQWNGNFWRKRKSHRNELCSQSLLPLPSNGELLVKLYKVCFQPDALGIYSTRKNISKILLHYWQDNKHIHQSAPGQVEVVPAYGKGIGIRLFLSHFQPKSLCDSVYYQTLCQKLFFTQYT